MSKKGGKKPPPEPEKAEPAVDPVKQELVVAQTQVQALTERVATLELENKRLNVAHNAVRDEYNTYKINQSDIYEYLSRTIDEQKGSIASLESRVEELRTRKCEMEEELAAERKQSSAAFAAMKDDLETENRKLSKHVIQVERWQRAMDTNHMLVEDFSHQLHRSRQNSANAIRELERQIILEREAHKANLEHMQSEAEKSAYVRARNQLKGTTKRTIIQNEKMATELEYQGAQTQKVLVASKRLGDEVATLRQHLELSTQTEAETASKLSVLQAVAKKLNAALADSRAAAEAREARLHADLEQARHERAAAEKGQERAEEETHGLRREVRGLRHKCRAAKEQYDRLAREYSYFEELQDETVAFLTNYVHSLRQEEMAHPDNAAHSPLPHASKFAHMRPDERARVVDHLVAKVTVFREHVNRLVQRDAEDRRAAAIGLGPQQQQQGSGGMPAEQIRSRAAAFAKAAATAAVDPSARTGPPSRAPHRGKSTSSPRSRPRRRRGPETTAIAERFASGEVAAASHIWRHKDARGSPRADAPRAVGQSPGGHEDSNGSLLPPIGGPLAGVDSAATISLHLPRETRAALEDDPWAAGRA